MTINKSLSWNNHIDNITKKANQTLAFIRRNINMCNRDSNEQAHKTFVRPTLEYASSVWNPHTTRNINAIEKVQRRAARFTTGIYHRTSSVSAILNALKWDSLLLRRARAKTIMLYGIYHRLVDIYHRKRTWYQPATARRPHSQVPSTTHGITVVPLLIISKCDQILEHLNGFYR